MIDKDFIPYELALELKGLGFDEPCLGYYSDKTGEDKTIYTVGTVQNSINSMSVHLNTNCRSYEFSAPTYSQAFRFFREKHNLRSFVDTIVHDVDSPNDWIYYFQVKMGNGIDTQPYYSGDFNSYEEVELACLRKLIKKLKASRG